MSHFDERIQRVPDEDRDGPRVELVFKQDVSSHSAGSLYRLRNRIASPRIVTPFGTLSGFRGVIHKD